MNRLTLAFLVPIFTTFASANSFAHDKVVVIPLGGDEAPTFKTMFVTPLLYTGDLKDETKGDIDGPSGADRRCMEFAEAPDSVVKGKTFKAWLSAEPVATFNGSHRQFVIHDLPYHNTKGETLSTNLWDLDVKPNNQFYFHTGQLGSSTAFGNPWTGIDADGTLPFTNCIDWTSSHSLLNGSTGNFFSSATGEWTERGPVPCSSSRGLICVEQ